MLKEIKGQLKPFCNNCGAALPVKRFAGKCHRCGQPRPFLVFDEDGRVVREQHSDVSLCMDVNIIHAGDYAGDYVDVRLPRYNFRQCAVTEKGENQDVELVRNFLVGNGVRFTEAGGAVISFRIALDEGQKVTTWVDAEGHGLRLLAGGLTAELEVRNRQILVNTTAKVKDALALAGMFNSKYKTAQKALDLLKAFLTEKFVGVRQSMALAKIYKAG